MCYLWSQSAPIRIAHKVPGAKILVVLRDPAERAWSQYLQVLGNGVICCSFREHIQHNLQHRSKQLSLNYPFLEFGLYSEQLRRYLDRFGANVWVGFHEDFQDRPSEVYQSICRFLGVAEGFSPSMERRHLEAQVPRVSLVGWAEALWALEGHSDDYAVKPSAADPTRGRAEAGNSPHRACG